MRGHHDIFKLCFMAAPDYIQCSFVTVNFHSRFLIKKRTYMQLLRLPKGGKFAN